MKKIFFQLLVASSIILPWFLSAQTNFQSTNRRFQHISIREGLSQVSINCILQDSMGFMWFGTQDGLNRYNGYEFKVYTNNPDNPDSLPNNFINTLYESPRAPGVLWVGTATGLCTFDLESEKFFSWMNDPRFDNALKNIPVTVIFEDREGVLWLGTQGEGLNNFNRENAVINPYTKTSRNPGETSGNNVKALTEDLDGNLWIGDNDGGLRRLDRKTGRVTVYKKSADGLGDDRVLSLLCDRAGDIWIGTDGSGLFRLHREKDAGETYSRFRYDPDNPGGLNSNYINTIFEDRGGLLWIGTNGGGVSAFRKETGQFINFSSSPTRPLGLNHNDVWRIYEDRAGSLWIGTQGGGINKLDRGYDNFILYQFDPLNPHGLKSKEIWEIIESKKGGFWIGTEGGLYRFNLETESFDHLKHNAEFPNSLSHNRLTSICEDGSGNLWLGSDGGGLYKYVPEIKKFSHYRHDPNNPSSLSHDRILSLIEDSTGVLWFGTERGGCCLLDPGNRDKENPSFTRYPYVEGDPFSLSNNWVMVIYEDRDHTVWLGTIGGGLNRFDRESKRFRHFKHIPGNANSLCDNRILSIDQDSLGYLWVGTFNGLNRFDYKKNLWKHYTTKDGLPNNVVYGTLEEGPPRNGDGDGSGGNLWISTNKGLAHFNRLTGEFKSYDIQDGLQGNEFNSNAYIKSSQGLMFFGGLSGFNVFDPRNVKDNPYEPPVRLTDFLIYNKPVPISRKGDSPLTKSITATRAIRLSHRQNSFSFGFAALNYINSERNRYRYMLESFDENWIYLEKRQMVSYTKVPPGEYVFRVEGANNDGKWSKTGAEVAIVITPPFWATWWFRMLMVFLLMGALALVHKRRTTLIRQRLERERLEKELKLKVDFTAMLVHDLRSPLTAIIGYSEMLMEMPEKVNLNRTGQVIAKSSDKMLRLINDMLDLSKFEAGRMALDKKESALYDVVTESIEIMRPLFLKKEINLFWEQEPGTRDDILFIDPEKIGQVVNNFLSNAIKYVPNRGNIVVKLLRVSEHFLELSESNDGPVIPEAERKYLFDKYAQLKTSVRIKGTGLGLAVSKIIIEAHGGFIGYRPGKDGVGSTFYFRLPRLNK